VGEHADAVKAHGSIAAAAREMGIAKSTFSDRLKREAGGSAPSKEKPIGGGITAEQLLLKHSPEHQIMHAAQEIPRGEFHTESDFIRRLSIAGGYKYIVEREEFSMYRGRASGGVFYWGHPDGIAAMKADGVLR